jgi:hypothetical protein
MTSSGNEPVTLLLVAQYLNQVHVQRRLQTNSVDILRLPSAVTSNFTCEAQWFNSYRYQREK